MEEALARVEKIEVDLKEPEVDMENEKIVAPEVAEMEKFTTVVHEGIGKGNEKKKYGLRKKTKPFVVVLDDEG